MVVIGCRAGENVQATPALGPEERKVMNVNTENRSTPSEPVRDIKFTSSLEKGESELKIKYSITNTGTKDIYVLDAYPAVDMETRSASADLKSFYLSFREPSTAVVLRGIPPLPSMPVTVRIMPLGTKVEPGATVVREFSVACPMRERSDWYYTPLPPEEYSDRSVDKIIFRLQFIRSTVEGFNAQPAHYAPEFFVTKGKNTVGQVETLESEFQIDKTQTFVRKDLFPRL